MPLESLLYSSSTSILISDVSFMGIPLTIDIGGWAGDDVAPLELPFEFPLANLNIGFGIDTVWPFVEFDIDWRFSMVDPVDLFFDDFSNADLVSFLGCFSAARSL